ncbi:hypothetical protein AB0M46_13940 [Dactylosporangium sp. NPDC051485]|uniref:hypothetical protein n=1 Tax=Dactylosporangium sp. NPDC051485 TaxID=3154846 RepID=UPI003428D4B8
MVRTLRSHRRLFAAAIVVVAVAFVAVAPGLPWPSAQAAVTGTGHTTCAPSGTNGMTCTGTFSGDTAWDPVNMVPISAPPTVTVNQTSELTYQSVRVSWTNFTPGDTSDYGVGIYECRGAVNDAGAVVPTEAPNLSWFDSQGLLLPDDVYRGGVGNTGKGSCYTARDDVQAWSGAANAGWYQTVADGTGQANIALETTFENKWLGCDRTHPCWLVVMPNWGGDHIGLENYDPQGRPTPNCADHNLDTDFVSDTAGNESIGKFCSWNDRIMVPVGFSETPSECPTAPDAFASEGSPLLARAMAQWRTGWCEGSNGLHFNYDGSLNEYQARDAFLHGAGALTSTLDLAMVTRPVAADAIGDSKRKFTYAPLANSSIAVAYYIDDPNTYKPITGIKLNARLMAKMLTQSYTMGFTSKCDAALTPAPFCDPAVAGNPKNILADPEFLALNPQVAGLDFTYSITGGLLPTVVAGNSDLTYELTRWIAADPEAAGFLGGADDGHGMHVNTNYRGVAYPLDQFQALDPGATQEFPNPGGVPSELWGMQSTWFPKAGLNNVASTLVQGKSTAVNYTGYPPPTGGSYVHAAMPVAGPGFRALFAVVSGADAAAFDFPTAQLKNAGGQFVAPTPESMGAAVNAYQTNDDGITQHANVTGTDPKAYPLTVTSYAVVPTCGLPADHAAAVTRMLNDVASSRQVPGTGAGQLGVGYLPLTSAQKTQTTTAAAKVGTGDCVSAPPPTSNPTSTAGGHTNTTSTTTPAGTATATPNSGSRPSGSASASTSAFANPSTRAAGDVHPDAVGLMQYTLPVLLVVGGFLAVAGPVTYLLGRVGAGPGLAAGARAAFEWLFGWMR